MQLIIWKEQIEDRKGLQFVGDIGVYPNIIAHDIGINDKDHLFFIYTEISANSFSECSDLFYSLFAQFLKDVGEITNNDLIKTLRREIRLRTKIRFKDSKLCGYVGSVMVFCCNKSIYNNRTWILRIFPISVVSLSIESGKIKLEEVLNHELNIIFHDLIWNSLK